MDSYLCKKCGGDMNPGKALAQTMVGGMPDFIGDTHSSTFSAGGPGKLIDCLKCELCGWSTTPLTEPALNAEDENPHCSDCNQRIGRDGCACPEGN